MTPSHRLARLTALACTVGACMSLATETPVEIAIPHYSTSLACPVEPDLFSLSIEQDRWLDWVGSTTRNDFFFNVLDNLQKLTGVPPRIRVGGKSQDVAYIDSNIQVSQAVRFFQCTDIMTLK